MRKAKIDPSKILSGLGRVSRGPPRLGRRQIALRLRQLCLVPFQQLHRLLGLADLTRSFKMPITATESVTEGLRGYPKYLTGNVVDTIRSVGDWIGGISAMRKAAALCEAFNTKYEPHSYGTTLVQAAHLHVMLAIHNCDLFELPVPEGILDIGMKDVIRVTKDGFVEAPTKPGLGYEVDWDKIKELTLREF